jgi:hypothetical protein
VSRATSISHPKHNGPIGHFWNGGEVVICTATTSPKARALARRPQVAVSINESMTRKVMTPEQIPAFQAAGEQMYEQMVRITIAPAWARLFDFGAGRLPAFLDRLAREAQQRSRVSFSRRRRRRTTRDAAPRRSRRGLAEQLS